MSAIPDPAFSLAPSGNLRRRAFVSRVFESGTVLASALAVTVLGIFVVYVAVRGISVMSWSFLTGSQLPPPTGAAGGMAPALLGTLELALIATLISLPVGIATAIYLTEYAGPRTGNAVRMMIDLMNGLPTIITGVFCFAVFVAPTSTQTALSASVALAIVMAPLITRASIEALSRVPGSLREAADALGVANWRTMVGVVLPTSAGAIATATILAVARAMGETAPILFNDTLYGPGIQLNPLHAVPNIPFEIYTLSETGYPENIKQAWGMAFVLLVTILALNIGARVMLRRNQRKMGL